MMNKLLAFCVEKFEGLKMDVSDIIEIWIIPNIKKGDLPMNNIMDLPKLFTIIVDNALYLQVRVWHALRWLDKQKGKRIDTNDPQIKDARDIFFELLQDHKIMEVKGKGFMTFDYTLTSGSRQLSIFRGQLTRVFAAWKSHQHLFAALDDEHLTISEFYFGYRVVVLGEFDSKNPGFIHDDIDLAALTQDPITE